MLKQYQKRRSPSSWSGSGGRPGSSCVTGRKEAVAPVQGDGSFPVSLGQGGGRLGRLVGRGQDVQWPTAGSSFADAPLLPEEAIPGAALGQDGNQITSLETMVRLGGSGVWAV